MGFCLLTSLLQKLQCTALDGVHAMRLEVICALATQVRQNLGLDNCNKPSVNPGAYVNSC